MPDKPDGPAVDPIPTPRIAVSTEFDVHTVARGVEECNALCAQGWLVYAFWIVEEVRTRGNVQRGEIRHPTPYYGMGVVRKRQSLAGLQEQAADVAADAQPQPESELVPEDQEDPGPAGESAPKPEPAPVPTRRPAGGGRVGGRRPKRKPETRGPMQLSGGIGRGTRG